MVLPDLLSDRPRAVFRSAVHLVRELPLWAALGRPGQGRGPRVVFLPSTGPEGAALLRIYNVARAMRLDGWRTLVLPPRLTLAQRQRLLAAAAPDVIVMQGARHVLNRPAFYRGAAIVYDIDDADFHLPHLTGPVRHAMGQVAQVIAGSRYIADWAQAAGAPRIEVVWTGTPPGAPPPPQSGRGPVVAWAQTRPMTYKAEAALVRRVMAEVAARAPVVTLRLYDRQPGDDPGFAASFAVPGLTVEWRKNALYRDYLASLDDVAVGLAPLCPETPFSRGKSFGKVLACLDRGVPVAGSDAGEHGAFFTPETGVITNDQEALNAGVLHLLADPGARARMASAARAAFLDRLTLASAVRRTERVLGAVIADDGARAIG